MRVSTALVIFTASLFVVTIVLAAQERFTLKAPNGIAFSEFKGYDAWQLINTSQPDDVGGCGTSKEACTKAILGNPVMIKAYSDGIPANGKVVPDGGDARQNRMDKGPQPRVSLRCDRHRDADRGWSHAERLEAIPGHERMGLCHLPV